MKNIISIFVFLNLLFWPKVHLGQNNIHIKGRLLHNTKYHTVSIKKFGIGSLDVASTSINKENGFFEFIAPPETQPGIYRVQWSQSNPQAYADFIINGQEEEISFEVDVVSENSLPHFLSPGENKILADFQRQTQMLSEQIFSIDQFLYNYPNKESAIITSMLQERKKTIQRYDKLFEKFQQGPNGFWAKQSMNFKREYFCEPFTHPKIKEFEMHENFWNYKTTSDTLFINTPLYTEAILDYLNFYLSPQNGFSYEEKNEKLKNCIDTILQKFSSSQALKSFALRYLQLGFNEIKEENILQYLDEKYALGCDMSVQNDLELKQRLSAYESVGVGKLIPEPIRTHFGINTEQENPQNPQKTILCFWASWCEHCLSQMPMINDWAKNNPKLRVIAISLDNDSMQYYQQIKQYPALEHSCDFKKWDGAFAQQLYVKATPTFFYLDEQGRVLKRLASFVNLMETLKSNQP